MFTLFSFVLIGFSKRRKQLMRKPMLIIRKAHQAKASVRKAHQAKASVR